MNQQNKGCLCYIFCDLYEIGWLIKYLMLIQYLNPFFRHTVKQTAITILPFHKWIKALIIHYFGATFKTFWCLIWIFIKLYRAYKPQLIIYSNYLSWKMYSDFIKSLNFIYCLLHQNDEGFCDCRGHFSLFGV